MDDHTKRLQRRNDPRAQYLRVLEGLVKGDRTELLSYFANERSDMLNIVAGTLVQNPRSQEAIKRLMTAIRHVSSQEKVDSVLEELIRASGNIGLILYPHFIEANNKATGKAMQRERAYREQKIELERQKKILEETQKELYALAFTDSLTGVKNRRFFLDQLVRVHGETERYKAEGIDEPYSLIHFDLDGFKDANDEHGHDAGDAALKEFVHRVGIAALANKHTNKFARLGGDEFIFLLPATRESGAKTLAQRIHDLMNASPIQYDDKTFPIGVSIGVWQYQAGETSKDVMREVDMCMYAAKQAYGGNCVVTGNMLARDLAQPVLTEALANVKKKLSEDTLARLLQYSSETKKV